MAERMAGGSALRLESLSWAQGKMANQGTRRSSDLLTPFHGGPDKVSLWSTA